MTMSVNARGRNASLNAREWAEGRVELRSLPRYLMVELTQGCNLHCPMCRPSVIGVRERSMDRGLLAQVAELLMPTAEVVDIRGWGESLIVADVTEVVRLVARHGACCRVVTNLSFRRPEVLDELVACEALIDVSIDSARLETVARSRTGARFDLVEANLCWLTAALATSPGGPDRLRVITTLQRSTVDDLRHLVRWLGDRGVRHVVINEVTLSPGDANALTGCDGAVDAEVDAAAKEAAHAGVVLWAGTRLGSRVPATKDAFTCIHPWAYATIGYDGSVGFCDHLIGPMMPLVHMGDVRRQSFEAIWNGERWQSLRRWHLERGAPATRAQSACAACYRHRNVDFEDIFEPSVERQRIASCAPT